MRRGCAVTPGEACQGRGAYANLCEHDRGSLTPGKAADMIAISDDLFELPAERIADCRVELTIVEGRVEHQLF
jgi:predicted amidohydrolase YtcJ